MESSVFSLTGFLSSQTRIRDVAVGMGFESDCASHTILTGAMMHPLGIQFLSFRPTAPKIILIISGTHGVEGPAGYDLQMDLLEKRVHEKLPADTGLVFVVALNPWGWANGRRTDGNNVDLNRNGLTVGAPSDTPPYTSEITALVHPKQCDEEWYRALSEQLADPVQCASLRAQVFRGQDADPKGIFYGGHERAWSLQQLDNFCVENLLNTCQHLAVLDIHTGLGEFGEIMLISSARPSDDKLIARVKSWFGLTPVFPKLGQTDRVNAVSSNLLFYIAQCLPRVQVTGLAVEIGTIPFEESFPIFVVENWLYHQPPAKFEATLADVFRPQAQKEVQRRFCQAFYPPIKDKESGQEWSAAARAGFDPIFRTVVRGLAEGCDHVKASP